MKRPGLLLLLLILSADVFVAQPQRIPTPGALFREWMASQQEQRRPLTRIAFTESMARSTDSFFGSRRLEMELEVTGYLQEDRWERLPRRARLNGQEVGPERWDQVERSLQQGAQQGFDDMLETFSLPLRLIRNLRPVGSTATETLKGVACWRFDMVPESPNGRIERMTLWFDQDAHRLIQAQAQARGGRNRGTHTLRLSFQRFEGFDDMLETFSLPLRLIRNLRPVGSTATETLKGVACWRFDLVPESPNGRIERMTLWFDQDQHRLIQAQAQARGGRNRGTHTLRLSFQRFEGFDLPVERYLEGNTQMNRRGRFYTVMLRATTVFSNYRLFYD